MLAFWTDFSNCLSKLICFLEQNINLNHGCFFCIKPFKIAFIGVKHLMFLYPEEYPLFSD